MGTFNTKVMLPGNPELIPTIAQNISDSFQFEGYEVTSDSLISGGYDISITKGGTFKAIVGMRTALKVVLTPQSRGIGFEASIGVFGQQSIPAIIAALFFWPVCIAQMWGLVQQSKLDDRVLQIARDTIRQHSQQFAQNTGQNNFNQAQAGSRFCTNCGASLAPTAKFCSHCGQPLS